MIIRILLLSLLAMLAGSVWLGYERGPFKKIALSLPASSRQSLINFIEIPALHQYRHGAHSYVGEVSMPSSCYRLESQSTVRESYPEQVKIDLLSVPESDESLCDTSSTTMRRFKVAFQASPEAQISVYFDGKPATFIITEATSSVSLEAQSVE